MAVSGIGGVFFRAKDPTALTEWYKTHFGVTMEGYDPWQQAAGPTVFQPFKESTDHWPPTKHWMINFRVENLDDTLAKLRQANITVETNPAWDSPEAGRFARVTDPEDNPIELWQPPLD